MQIIYAIVFLIAFSSFITQPSFAQNKTLNDISNIPSGPLFTIHGSNTVGAHLAPNWAKGYLEHLGVTGLELLDQGINEVRVAGQYSGQTVFIDIFAHGSSTGFKALEKGLADIAMSSRSIKSSENQKLAPRHDLRHHENEHVVAIDGLAIIVNKTNPIDALTIDQLKAIFSGKVTNWKQVGGANSTIIVHARDDKSGTWDTFKSLVLDNKNPLSSRATRFESNDDLASFVARQSNAIGFVALASINNTKALAISDGASLQLMPQQLTVATEDYPLSRRLYMYTLPALNNPFALDYVEFAKSQSGQQIVQDVGFISQNPISIAGKAPDNGPEGYSRLVENGQRLSINFRFQQGSAELDNKAKQDIQRLTQYMQLPENKLKRVQLIGFGDYKQRETLALAFSKLRALAVKSALHKEGVQVEPVMGFGSYLPIASNESDNKIRNQRVEVWIFNDNADIYRDKPAENLTATNDF